MQNKFNIAILGCFLFLFIPYSLKAQSPFIGNWKGALTVNGIKLDIFFHIQTSTMAELKGSIDVPLQRLKRFPMDEVNVKSKKSIQCIFNSINAEYSGNLTDTNKINGVWKQNGSSLKLELSKYYGCGEVLKNQTPRPPFPYTNKQVSFSDKDGKIKFGGTLTVPDTNKFKGKRPGVILFTGSGSQDRDESIGNHKPFAVIAHTLTQSGFSVLRLDDRGVGATKCSPEKLIYTTTDLVDDGICFVNFLKSQNTIDSNRIFLMGHSEGGAVVEKTAGRIPSIKGIIGLAPMVADGLETNVFQNEFSLQSMGLDSVQIQTYIDLHRHIVRESLKLGESISDSLFKAMVNNEIKNWKMRFPKKITTKIEKKFKRVTQQKFNEYTFQTYGDLNSNLWFRTFLTLKPIEDLTQLKCPVLIIQGSKDHQICAKQSKPLIQALQQSGKSNIEYTEFPELNHLLQTCNTGTVSEYFDNEETISPMVLKTMTQWLIDHSK